MNHISLGQIFVALCTLSLYGSDLPSSQPETTKKITATRAHSTESGARLEALLTALYYLTPAPYGQPIVSVNYYSDLGRESRRPRLGIPVAPQEEHSQIRIVSPSGATDPRSRAVALVADLRTREGQRVQTMDPERIFIPNMPGCRDIQSSYFYTTNAVEYENLQVLSPEDSVAVGRSREEQNREIIRLINPHTTEEFFETYIEREGIELDRRLNSLDETMLMRAVGLQGNNYIARWLLEQAAARQNNIISLVNQDGISALVRAISSRNVEGVRLLLHYSTEDHLLRRDRFGRTILFQAAEASWLLRGLSQEDTASLRVILRLLLGHRAIRALINEHPEGEVSAYWHVRNDPELRELFLQHGAIPEQRISRTTQDSSSRCTLL